MPLITCPDCSHYPVSDRAETCPQCGCPLKAHPAPASSSEAATSRVSISGRGKYSTIAEALENSCDGDELILESGTFQEALVVSKSVTIRSRLSDSTALITAISDNVITVKEDIKLVLIDIRIRANNAECHYDENGNAIYGSNFSLNASNCNIEGQVRSHDSHLCFQKCKFAGIPVLDGDGEKVTPRGIQVNGGSLRISRCRFSGHSDSIYTWQANTNIEHVEISESSYGVKSYHGELSILELIIDKCKCGIEADSIVGHANISGCRIEGSGTTGISASHCKLMLRDVHISAFHEGIEAYSSELNATSCVINGDKAIGFPEGIVLSDSKAILSNCTIMLNHCGVYCRKESSIREIDCRFSNNDTDIKHQ